MSDDLLLRQLMEQPANHDVAPAVTSLRTRDDNNSMKYARRCVVMEIIKAETDYVSHLLDVVQVKTTQTSVYVYSVTVHPVIGSNKIFGFTATQSLNRPGSKSKGLIQSYVHVVKKNS